MEPSYLCNRNSYTSNMIYLYWISPPPPPPPRPLNTGGANALAPPLPPPPPPLFSVARRVKIVATYILRPRITIFFENCAMEHVALGGDHYCSLQWRHNERDCVSNHRRLDCLLNRLFRCRSKKTSKLRVTGFCEVNSLPHCTYWSLIFADDILKCIFSMTTFQFWLKNDRNLLTVDRDSALVQVMAWLRGGDKPLHTRANVHQDLSCHIVSMGCNGLVPQIIKVGAYRQIVFGSWSCQ